MRWRTAVSELELRVRMGDKGVVDHAANQKSASVVLWVVGVAAAMRSSCCIQLAGGSLQERHSHMRISETDE